MVGRPEGPGVLHGVRGHPVPLLADVDPPDIEMDSDKIFCQACQDSPVVIVGGEALDHYLPLRVGVGDTAY